MTQQRLLDILCWKRPHGSECENQFVHNFIRRGYPQHTVMGPMENICIHVPGPLSVETMFSCHTDTVHTCGGYQHLTLNSIDTEVVSNDGILGADDGTGIYIMLEMISAQVPGVYMFHRGEERGGLGSAWMAENETAFLRTFKRAIAFDRKGKTSVITSQLGQSCCSDSFGNALAKALSAMPGTTWNLDPTGSFTDTANYTSLIPECTNISVGYINQHTRNESQDLTFAVDLAKTMSMVNYNALPTVRCETKVEPPRAHSIVRSLRDIELGDVRSIDHKDLARACAEDPEAAADIIQDFAEQHIPGGIEPLRNWLEDLRDSTSIIEDIYLWTPKT